MNWQDLLKRKAQLALMQNIPSMADYAEEWNKLAADFLAIGFTACAEDCFACFVRYRDMALGEYVRLIEQPFAELVEVPA